MKRKLGCGVLGIMGILLFASFLASRPAVELAATPVQAATVVLAATEPVRQATITVPTPTVAEEVSAEPYSPPTPTALRNANLRAGPGTNYQVVGSVAAGEELAIVGQNEQGDWYQLEDGQWIAIGQIIDAPYVDVVSSDVAPAVVDVGGSCENRCVKGNISLETDERIYHIPGCDKYEDTDIDESLGERWFATEAEAVAAGWRKAKNCP